MEDILCSTRIQLSLSRQILRLQALFRSHRHSVFANILRKLIVVCISFARAVFSITGNPVDFSSISLGRVSSGVGPVLSPVVFQSPAGSKLFKRDAGYDPGVVLTKIFSLGTVIRSRNMLTPYHRG